MTQGCKIRDQEATYYLTFTVVYWIGIFTRDIYRKILIESLKFCQKEKGLEIFTYVIMSNHVHLIVRSRNNNLSATIRDLKKNTSKQIVETIKTNPESRREWMMERAATKHKRNTKFQFWPQKNHPVELQSNNFFEQKMQYIHENPVRNGLVDKPEDYRYSSARNYAEAESLIDIVMI